jgi:hypothetical protein
MAVDQDVLASWQDRLERICRAITHAEQAGRLRAKSAAFALDQIRLAQERAATAPLHTERWLTDPLRSARILVEGAVDIEQAIVSAICRAERKPEPILAKPKPAKVREIKPYTGPPDTQCGYGGCQRKARARGYCSLHYTQLRGSGKLEVERRTRAWCIVEGCDRVAYAKGYCLRHYRNFSENGDPIRLRSKATSCCIENCDNPVEARGYCKKHLYRLRAYGDPLASSPYRSGRYTTLKPGQKACTVDGCSSPSIAHGVCMKHYRRNKREYRQTRVRRLIKIAARPFQLKTKGSK